MSWLLFFLRGALLSCALYIPGFLCFSRFRVPAFLLISIAPTLSIISLTLSMAFFYAIHLALDWPFYLMFLLFESAIGARINAVWIKRRFVELKNNVSALILYLVASFIVVLFVYVKTLDGPDSVIPLYDTANTLSEVRCYANTNLYGSIFSSFYLDSPSLDLGSTYYPSSFHAIAALVSNWMYCSSAEAINITIFVALCEILPLSTWAFIKACFPDNKLVEICGAFASMSFVAFPWGLLIWGSLHTNLFSLVLVPSFVASLAMATYRGTVSNSYSFIPVILCGITLALLHPGALFSAGVICIPLIFHRARALASNNGNQTFRSIVLYVTVAFLICSAWIFCYKLPPLQPTVTYCWKAFMGFAEAFSKIVTLAFADYPAQLTVSLIILIGVCACLRRGEESSWLILSALLGAVLYFIDVTMDGDLKQLLTGFWYTDSRRVAALVVIPLMPVLAYGTSRIVEMCRGYLLARADSKITFQAIKIIVLLTVAILIFGPTLIIPGGPTLESSFSFVRSSLASLNELKGRPMMDGSVEVTMLDKEELDAGKEIKAIIGSDDSIVLNNALDGSTLLYGLFDIKLFYRSCSGQLTDGVNELLRKHVDSYVYDPDVKQILLDRNIKYVLQLDSGRTPSAHSSFELNYDSRYWAGIQSVNPETPGFDLIYQKDDICLYRLTDL